MIPDAHLNYVLGPALIVLVAISLVLRLRMNRLPNELQRALAELRLTTIGTGIFLLLLWFVLPQTAVLGSFGFPDSVDAVQSPKQVLKYLQDYNRALVRTTTVLHWFIFVFVWWFLTAFHSLTKALAHGFGPTTHQASGSPRA